MLMIKIDVHSQDRYCMVEIDVYGRLLNFKVKKNINKNLAKKGRFSNLKKRQKQIEFLKRQIPDLYQTANTR